MRTGGTKRQKALRHAIRDIVPLVPLADSEPIYEAALSAPSLRRLPPSVAAWLAVTSHVRHRHTDYDQLLAEGYDAASARHFVLDAINETLTLWGGRRLLEADDEHSQTTDIS